MKLGLSKKYGGISWLLAAAAMGGILATLGAITSRAVATSTAPRSRPEVLNVWVASAPRSTDSASPRQASSGLAKFEPQSGCLLGAYIELDPLLQQIFVDQNLNPRKLPDEFEGIVGKQHAMYFFYLGYGQRLPMDWVRYLVEQGKLVHIALEPNIGLGQVLDDAYLTELADDMKRSGAKIFLRFASEMNGSWTAYHGNPDEYQKKFRIVSSVMKKRAPNVAMVWCPYFKPAKTIKDYYPGDQWVDWVGVNMYSVTYFNQDLSKPASNVRPRDMINAVYRDYASRKPIMVCEYATTHFSPVENQRVSDFAVQNIEEFYMDLRKRYPRVKAINYFNSNNLLVAHRKNNDYSLTEDPKVLEAYQKAIRSDYFIARAVEPVGGDLGNDPVPLSQGLQVSGRLRVKVWQNTFASISAATLRIFVNGEMIHSAELSEKRHGFWLETAELPTGANRLVAEARDLSGKLVAWYASDFRVVH